MAQILANFAHCNSNSNSQKAFEFARFSVLICWWEHHAWRLWNTMSHHEKRSAHGKLVRPVLYRRGLLKPQMILNRQLHFAICCCCAELWAHCLHDALACVYLPYWGKYLKLSISTTWLECWKLKLKAILPPGNLAGGWGQVAFSF